MAKAIDISGKRFGRLTAVRDIGSLRSFRLWEFACDCGSVIERTSVDVRSGKVSSCGCYRSECISARVTADMTGQRVGRLAVLDRAGVDVHGKALWRCACDCGAETIAVGASLRKGSKRSCGCLQREAAAATQRGKSLPPEIKRASVRASAAKQRVKRKADPIAMMQARLSRLHRHALRQVGAIKSSPTFTQLGYSVEQFVAHIERQFAKGMGWHNMSEWQIDHIVPVSSAKAADDVIALNQLPNLRPMWARENNAKKNARTHLI
jgi:hypothetical protein